MSKTLSFEQPASSSGFTGRRLQGGAYGRPRGESNALLTQVGPGTPCGELMRRYWQPVGVSDMVKDIPQKVRVLGEDLILFRDRKGRAGLLHNRCSHRGTTLFYGKVEEQGIRCCYHGWLFAVDGTCLEQPCEPDGGRNRDVARQPWYPVEERYGLVFAYMGPLDRKPPLPRYDILENLGPDERLDQDRNSFYVGGARTAKNPYVPWSWLQDWEVIMDPFHVFVLHSTFSGVQFQKDFALRPTVEWERMDHGVAYIATRTPEGKKTLRRTAQVLMPNIRIVPTPELTAGPSREIGWLVPGDDTSHRSFGVARVGINEDPIYERRSRLVQHDGKIWAEMNEEEHQKYPDDFEAQMGQGPISLHSEEHLATTDRGIVMMRRLMAEQIRAVQDGKDPIGAGPDAPELVATRAGNFFE